MLSQKQSNDINLLKGISILLVLFIHANIKDAMPCLDDKTALGMWTQVATRILVDNAVPMFFLVSGFMFFLKPGSIVKKMKKRIRTLLLPYILWCIVGFLIPFVLQEMLGLAHLFSGTSLKKTADFEATDYIKMFWNIRDGAPILSTMWFLRDLIVVIMLTPAIRLLIRIMPRAFPVILICVYLLLPFHVAGMSSSTLFWFGMGCWFAIREKNPFAWIERSDGILLSAVWMPALIACIISFYYDWHYETVHDIFGMIHFVAIYKCVSATSMSGIPKWLTAVSTASFFIYAFHEPWMGYVLKVLYKTSHPSGLTLYIAPFILVAFATTYSYAAYALLKRYAPCLLNLLTGGRIKQGNNQIKNTTL